jgi:hypothetical protein
MVKSEQSLPVTTADTGDGRIGDHYFSLLYAELHRGVTGTRPACCSIA